MAAKEDIVILGGGFVGLVLARRLVRAGVVGKQCEVTVIDKSTSHTYTPWLYEVSSGYVSRNGSRRERCKLYTSASVSFTTIPGYQHVRFRHEAVTRVDTKAKIVFLSDGLTIRYSTLIIALGSQPNFFGIPGFPENCVPLKSAADAMEIERRVRELVGSATTRERKSIAIIGGGPTGVEFTGELMMTIRRLEARGELQAGALTVSLIDRHEPLDNFPPALGRAAVKRLKKLGVQVRQGSVTEATARALVLKDNHGDAVTLPTDLCVWSGGVMPSTVVKELGLPMDPKGRLIVDATFAVSGAQGVYAAGDCASLFNPRTQEAEPMSAQTSVWQGMWMAANFVRQFSGKPMKPFPFRKRWDTLVTVGGKYGVGYIRGFVVKGPLAFYARRLTDGAYFSWILPAVFAFQKWATGVVLYNKND
jgi:NADH dehydrogenase